ncbi:MULTISPECIES: class I SAM-dependent methyltransferase [unclassified Methylosinus]|uniref:class I SAM-dependent methyltransferase n=1 Tax=unclassified Methylosinus TaxID=2624500 RepID=UPI000A987677|nr:MULTISPECIES: class I SAM-dependent methyltransferase [unclassified Methylosinus]
MQMKHPTKSRIREMISYYLSKVRSVSNLTQSAEHGAHLSDRDESELMNAVSFHDDLADAWDDKYLSGGFQRRVDFFRRKIAPAIARPGRWLDAGCGSGFFSRLLADRERHFTGLDASTPMINSARHLAKRYGLSDLTQFETVADLDRLSYADGYFAGCICLSVIEYLDRPYQCLDELARVIEPGGFLIVSVPHANSPLRFAQRLADRRFRWSGSGAWSYLSVSKFETTPSALDQAFFERGFNVTEMFEFDPLIPAPLLRVFPPSLIFAIAVKNGVAISEQTVEGAGQMETRRGGAVPRR